jgi:mannitol/fructose-specific phosphotransferase system IIA component (Ntr-type)
MDSILDALQEGRLFELPENDKNHALQFLAHIIEAFPQIPTGTDIVGNVMAREKSMHTALGRGWACPHARVEFEEDLMCVVGWSPTGIDYGAPDGIPVSLITMYLVPSNQRNHYLREVSIMAKVPSLAGDRQVAFN